MNAKESLAFHSVVGWSNSEIAEDPATPNGMTPRTSHPDMKAAGALCVYPGAAMSGRRSPPCGRSVADLTAGQEIYGLVLNAVERSRAAYRLEIAEDGFDLEILQHALEAVLASVSGLLETAKRRVWIPGRVVEMHLTGADLGREVLDDVHVLALHMGPEAIDRIIRDGNGLLQCLVGDDAKDRPEDLLLGDAHARAHLGKDRRFNVEPGIQTART